MPEGAKTGGLSVWAILLIIAGLFLILYIVSYVYFNLTKKKIQTGGTQWHQIFQP